MLSRITFNQYFNTSLMELCKFNDMCRVKCCAIHGKRFESYVFEQIIISHDIPEQVQRKVLIYSLINTDYLIRVLKIFPLNTCCRALECSTGWIYKMFHSDL